MHKYLAGYGWSKKNVLDMIEIARKLQTETVSRFFQRSFVDEWDVHFWKIQCNLLQTWEHLIFFLSTRTFQKFYGCVWIILNHRQKCIINIGSNKTYQIAAKHSIEEIYFLSWLLSTKILINMLWEYLIPVVSWIF